MLMDLTSKDTRAQPFMFSVFIALYSPLIPIVAMNYLALLFRQNITSCGKPFHLNCKCTLFFLCYLQDPSYASIVDFFHMQRTYSVHLAHTKFLVLQAQKSQETKHVRTWEYPKLWFPIIWTQIFGPVIYWPHPVEQTNYSTFSFVKLYNSDRFSIYFIVQVWEPI